MPSSSCATRSPMRSAATPAATSTATQAASGSSGGTVTGDAVSTQYGDVQVRVTVYGGRITSVQALLGPDLRLRRADPAPGGPEPAERVDRRGQRRHVHERRLHQVAAVGARQAGLHDAVSSADQLPSRLSASSERLPGSAV